MRHTLFINSNGKPEKSWLWLKSPLSPATFASIFQVVSKRSLIKQEFLLTQNEYEDFLKLSKE